MSRVVRSHEDLEVHEIAYGLAMRIFEVSKLFPREETYSLTDQIRRSSRAVTANIAEAWMKRRYEAAFILRLTDAAGEAAETIDWLRYASDCGYLQAAEGENIQTSYRACLKTLNSMILYSSRWCGNEKGFKPQATSHKPHPTNPREPSVQQ